MSKCPLCGEVSCLDKLYTVSVEEVFSFINNGDTRIIDEIKKIWGHDSCNFMKCNKCDFCFADPFKGGTEILYSIIYSKDSYPINRWEYEKALEKIEKDDVCLEIGAGENIFINKLKNKLAEENVKSVEISNDKSDYKSVDEISNSQKFSKIFMFHVLEHLDNFKNVIEKINKITTESSKLIISVPSGELVDFMKDIISSTDNPPIHVSRWNKKTINMLNSWKISESSIKYCTKSELFKFTFFGLRTKKYPRSRNPVLMLMCLIEACVKYRYKKVIKDQFFILNKTSTIKKANRGEND